jgi:hypothetical protein
MRGGAGREVWEALRKLGCWLHYLPQARSNGHDVCITSCDDVGIGCTSPFHTWSAPHAQLGKLRLRALGVGGGTATAAGFMALAQAKAEGQDEAARMMESAVGAAMAAKQATLRPEIQLLNRLLAAGDASTRAAVCVLGELDAGVRGLKQFPSLRQRVRG